MPSTECKELGQAPNPWKAFGVVPKPELSGRPAIFVLADEAPRIHRTPIAPDHPTTPSPPQSPFFPIISAPPTVTSQSTQNHTAADQSHPSSRNAPASSQNPLPRLSIPTTTTRRRRRRSSSSPETAQSEPSSGTRGLSDLPEDQEDARDGAGVPASRLTREGPSTPKRARLMSTTMRQDSEPSNSSSNGARHFSNGSSRSPPQKATISNTTNGHSPTTNGTSSSYTNGSSPSITRTKNATFYGHDREEITRLLIQTLSDLGYHGAAGKLGEESGYELESPSVAAFRHAVLQGEWLEAESLLFGSNPSDEGGGVSISNGHPPRHRGLVLAEGADASELKFRMRQQKYLELLEKRELEIALTVLRQELTPLHRDQAKLHALSR